jgi:MYXO-CTERM domain-containing protein
MISSGSGPRDHEKMQDRKVRKLFAAKGTGRLGTKACRVLLGAAVAIVAACSAPGNDPLDTSGAVLSNLVANDKAAYDYFVTKGLTNFQAAAVVGNLDQESGVDPNISQFGGGPGRGIAQWSTGGRWDTISGDNLVAYAAMQGQPTNSLAVQLDFIWYELGAFPQYGLAKLRATTNVTDATAVFEDDYEGCVYANFPVCDLPRRVTFAKNVLAAYGSNPVPRDGGVTGDGGTPVDGKTAADGTGGADGKTIDDGPGSADGKTLADGAPTADRATADDGAATSDASTTVLAPDAKPLNTDDAGAPDQRSDAEPTSEAGQRVSTPAGVDSSGCSIHSGGADGSDRGWWLVAIGLVLASVRLRRLKA